MKKWEFALLTGLILAFCLTQFTAFAETCAAVRSDTLRLHILANSDSSADQTCKLAVRDAILAQHGSLFATAKAQPQAAALARASLPAIEKTAAAAVRAAGYDYAVNARVERMFFDTRAYDGFTLPAGEYEALRVELGTAEGKNWFCVMYPPLCLPAAAPGSKMAVYSPEERAAISSPYTVKFAFVELFEKLK